MVSDDEQRTCRTTLLSALTHSVQDREHQRRLRRHPLRNLNAVLVGRHKHHAFLGVRLVQADRLSLLDVSDNGGHGSVLSGWAVATVLRVCGKVRSPVQAWRQCESIFGNFPPVL